MKENCLLVLTNYLIPGTWFYRVLEIQFMDFNYFTFSTSKEICKVTNSHMKETHKGPFNYTCKYKINFAFMKDEPC